MKTVVTVDVKLDRDNFHENARSLLRIVRPSWENDVALKNFTSGITNKMIGYHQDGDESDIVLIRINGNKTEVFLDREKEVSSFQKLHSAGCAPELYCIFKNGLCYEYIPGNTVTREEVRQPHVFRLIAREMVKLHKIPMQTNGETEASCFSLIKKFLYLRFSDDAPAGQSLENYEGPSEADLQKEAAILEQHILKLDSRMVLCHNDLLLNNIIFNKTKGTMHFIDYEYTGLNYPAYDIANHFCEFAGVDDVDYSYYPDRALQMVWLKEYLRCWKADCGDDVSNREIEDLYVEVNKFALVAHFVWATWALVQAKYSSIDFDYLQYSAVRLDEYFRRKDEFLAL